MRPKFLVGAEGTHAWSGWQRTVVRLAVLFLTLALMVFVDYIVNHRIYHAISEARQIPFNEIDVDPPVPSMAGTLLWWHVAFIPLVLSTFALLGLAARDWRLAVSGIVLFLTGWEDILYYVLQLRLLPAELPWLDRSPGIGWGRYLFASPHVTALSLLISAAVGGVVVALLLGGARIFQRSSPSA